MSLACDSLNSMGLRSYWRELKEANNVFKCPHCGSEWYRDGLDEHIKRNHLDIYRAKGQTRVCQFCHVEWHNEGFVRHFPGCREFHTTELKKQT